MAFIHYNPNPHGEYVGDCVIRAITKALDKSWNEIYLAMALVGYSMGDMPSSNRVWGQFLKDVGYRRYVIPNTCPDCYTIRDFCEDNPKGTFIVGTGTHCVCIKDGNLYDTWDSSDETPLFYYMEG